LQSPAFERGKTDELLKSVQETSVAGSVLAYIFGSQYAGTNYEDTQQKRKIIFFAAKYAVIRLFSRIFPAGKIISKKFYSPLIEAPERFSRKSSFKI